MNLGPAINGPGNGEIAASLTPDGHFLFFASDRIHPGPASADSRLTRVGLQALARQPGANGDVALYWMDAGFLKDLRAKAVWPQTGR